MKNSTLILAFAIMFMVSAIPTNLCYGTDQLKHYSVIGASYDGFRTARAANGLVGYIDEEGNPLTPFVYDWAFDFNNGVGLVYTEDGDEKAFSAINKKGEVLNFKKELGYVSFYNGNYGIVSLPTNNPKRPEKSALIDSNGNLTTEYYDGGIYTITGRPTAKGEVFLVNKGGQRGAIKGNGEWVVPIEYDLIECYSEDSRIISVGKKIGNDYKYGCINFDGKVLFDCNLDSPADFSDGYGVIEQNRKYAIVDRNGNLMSNFMQYDGIYLPFNEGIAVVKNNTGYGCIDYKGKLMIPFQYSSMNFSKNGYFKAVLINNSTEVILRNPLIEQRKINVYLNNNWLYLEQEPIIEEGRTLAPFRSIAEALGYAVEWDDETKSITLQNAEKIINLKIESNEATVNVFDDGKEAETILLDAPANIVNGRTFVPVRFLAENIGAKITWNQETKTINIQN